MRYIPAERFVRTQNHSIRLTFFYCSMATGYNLVIGFPSKRFIFCRPPISLLRQELAGTCIYLDILQKTTGHCIKNEEHSEANGSSEADHTSFNSDEEKLVGIAEDKLVSFCEQVLKEASALQSNVVESTNMDIHRVLELRSPVIVKVHLLYLVFLKE